jgi:hypothetical protein
MPRSAAESPLSYRNLRVLVGPALCVHWASTLNEWRLDRLDIALSDALVRSESRYRVGPLRDLTNQCRQWLAGSVPSQQTVDQLDDALPQTPSASALRNHSFWLLFAMPVRYETIDRVFRELPRSHQATLFPHRAGPAGDAQRLHNVSSLEIDWFNEVGDWPALTALTAGVWEARITRLMGTGPMLARQTRLLFPRVVANTPVLYVRWPHLARLYQDQIWYDEGLSDYTDCAWTLLPQEVADAAEKARARGVALPPEKWVDRRPLAYDGTTPWG